MYEVGDIYLTNTRPDDPYQLSLIVITKIEDDMVVYNYIAKEDSRNMKYVNVFGSYILMKIGVVYEWI